MITLLNRWRVLDAECRDYQQVADLLAPNFDAIHFLDIDIKAIAKAKDLVRHLKKPYYIHDTPLEDFDLSH